MSNYECHELHEGIRNESKGKCEMRNAKCKYSSHFISHFAIRISHFFAII